VDQYRVRGYQFVLDEQRLRVALEGEEIRRSPSYDANADSGWAMVEKTAAFRQRRAADTARWRERLSRGAAVYPVEVDGTTFDLMERFGGLDARKVDNKRAVAAALGRLWHRALAALLREADSRR
jgi:hypothetical protein